MLRMSDARSLRFYIQLQFKRKSTIVGVTSSVSMTWMLICFRVLPVLVLCEHGPMGVFVHHEGERVSLREASS